MTLARETVYEALFGFVVPLLAPGAVIGGPLDGQAAGTPTLSQPFNIVSRETKEVQRVPPELQPVLFMDEAVEEFVDRGAGLTSFKWTIYFHIGCTSMPGTPAATILNPLIDLVYAALQHGPAFDVQQLGLGDAIERAQFKGMAVKKLGDNSLNPTARQTVVYVPFEIIFA